MHADTHVPKVRVRHDPGNPSEAERDERNATNLPFWSWCENSVAGKMRDLPHQQRSSDRDVLERRWTTSSRTASRMAS